MRLKSILTAALGLTVLGTMPALASDSPKIYAYPSSANYCPLRPATRYNQWGNLLWHTEPDDDLQPSHAAPRPAPQSQHL